MFKVTIHNLETDEKITEIVNCEKEMDEFVESMHNVYGDVLGIDIDQALPVQEEIKTRPYSEPPVNNDVEESSPFVFELTERIANEDS